MKILFVSENCSDEMYTRIERERFKKLLPAQQKFFRLLLEGLLYTAECDIDCLSAVPVSASCHSQKKWAYQEENISEHLNYKYLPFTNTKFRRYITQFISTYRLCSDWLRKNKHVKDKIIIVDSTVMQCALAAKIAAKVNKCNIVGVVTDIAKYTTQIIGGTHSYVKKIFRNVYDIISNYAVKGLDGYIFLSEYMNEELNIQKNPYLIVEGIASNDFFDNNVTGENKTYAMYAGGIYEKFGIVTLAKAYASLNTKYPLHVYGCGPDVEKIIELENANVKYMGVLNQKDIMVKEREARLLINPRPSKEEFTKFSFPSKTMEYMASGTAVLSTPLKGIPEEYRPYIFWFDDETESGMARKVQEILSLQDEELQMKGKKARDFVIANKNYIKQGKRVLHFLKQIKEK